METQEDRVRIALNAARVERQVGEMALALGIRRQQLSGFLNGGKLKPAYLKRAEVILREWNCWIWDNVNSTQSQWTGVAAELRGCAAILESSGFNDGAKAYRLTQLITLYHREFEAIIASQQEGSND